MLRHVLNIAKAHFRHNLGTVLARFSNGLGTYTVITTQIFAQCPPMDIFYIPHPILSFNPESHSQFASKS